MKPENKVWLDRLRHHRKTQVLAQFIGQVQMEERKELLRIAREEFDPNYMCCITCPEDLYRLIEFVYTQEEKLSAAIESIELKTEGEELTIGADVSGLKPENEEAQFLSTAITSEPPSDAIGGEIKPPPAGKGTNRRKRR